MNININHPGSGKSPFAVLSTEEISSLRFSHRAIYSELAFNRQQYQLGETTTEKSASTKIHNNSLATFLW